MAPEGMEFRLFLEKPRAENQPKTVKELKRELRRIEKKKMNK